MSLHDLFIYGGLWYMVIISICGIAMLFFSVRKVIELFILHRSEKQGLDMILLFGSLSLVIGILAQAIGLFEAFDAIEVAGDISPRLLAGGVKISMITTLYGAFIFLFSLIVWGILREILIRKEGKN